MKYSSETKSQKNMLKIDPPFSGMSLLVDPNNGCNLNCIHCGLACAHLVHFSKQDIMSPEKFYQVIELLEPYINSLSIGCIREPLVHPRIEEILMLADKLSETISLSLTTNAVLLKPPLTEIFVQARHDWTFYISIESANPVTYEKIRKGAIFDSFHRNVKNLCSLKTKRPHLKIYFSTVVMKSNLHDLDKLFDYAHSLGIDGILLMDLEPHAHNEHLELTNLENKEWQVRFTQIKDRFQNEKMMINMHDTNPAHDELIAVMNQRGEVYPPGFRQPLGNIFTSSGIKTILNYYQNTANPVLER